MFYQIDDSPDDLIEVMIDIYNRVKDNTTAVIAIATLILIYVIRRYGPAPTDRGSEHEIEIAILSAEARAYRDFLEIVMAKPNMDIEDIKKLLKAEALRMYAERDFVEYPPGEIIKESSRISGDVVKKFRAGADYLIIS